MDIEKLFFSLTSSLPYPVVVTDGNPEDPRIILVNEAFEAMTGYEREELRGENPKILQGEKTEREALTRLKYCLRQRKNFEGATWNYRKNGEPYLLKWCIKPFSAEGKDYFVAIQQELNEENSDERMRLSDEFVVSLTQNLTAFYRNSLSVYQHFHQVLRDGEFDGMKPEEIIEMLQVRDSVTLAATMLTEYLIDPGKG